MPSHMHIFMYTQMHICTHKSTHTCMHVYTHIRLPKALMASLGVFYVSMFSRRVCLPPPDSVYFVFGWARWEGTFTKPYSVPGTVLGTAVSYCKIAIVHGEPSRLPDSCHCSAPGEGLNLLPTGSLSMSQDSTCLGCIFHGPQNCLDRMELWHHAPGTPSRPSCSEGLCIVERMAGTPESL